MSFQEKEAVLKAFEDICIKQIYPDFSQLDDVTNEVFDSTKEQDTNYKLAEKLAMEYYQTPSPTIAQQYQFEEAVRYIYNNYQESFYGISLAAIYCDYGQYEKSKTLYKSHTYEYSAAYSLAKLICEGKFGKPDYQLAYEYYTHSTLLLDDAYSTLSQIEIAKMYRDGKYVQQNYNTYVNIIKNLEKDCLKISIDICLHELYYELALIALHEGNKGKAREYCYRAKYWAYFFADATYDFEGLNNALRIAKLYYCLFDWDTNDMELLDLLYLFQKPAIVIFMLNDNQYQVESIKQNNRIIIKFLDEYFNGSIDFIMHAMIDKSYLYEYKKIIQFIEVIQ